MVGRRGVEAIKRLLKTVKKGLVLQGQEGEGRSVIRQEVRGTGWVSVAVCVLRWGVK